MRLILVGLVCQGRQPQIANAVSCPSSGAKIEVCVDNQTSDTPTVYVAGNAISNEITCTGPAPILGAYQHTIALPANQKTCYAVGSVNPPLPLSGGLMTGMYVHRIYYAPPPTPGTPTPGPTPTPPPRAAQYQQGPMVYNPPVSGTPAKWARIEWVYNKTVLTVNSTADSSCNDTNCQAGSCTLRRAINKARQGATARPVLINFNLPAPSTIQLTSTGSGCGMLRLDQAAPSGTTASNGEQRAVDEWRRAYMR